MFVSSFVDVEGWPLVCLHMPRMVPDHEADARVGEIAALYDRGVSFVLIMDGAELPVHSPRFMKAYTRWSEGNRHLQEAYCLAAIRIEADPELRAAYQERAVSAVKAGLIPYPYMIVSSVDDARALATTFLS